MGAREIALVENGPSTANVMVLRTIISFADDGCYTSVTPGPVDGPWLRSKLGDERFALLILAGDLTPWVG